MSFRASLPFILIASAALGASALAAQEIPGDVARPADVSLLRGLINKPQAITAKVTPFMRNGQSWCTTEAECIAVFRMPLDSLAALLRDHPNYPKIFPRISSNVVRKDGDRLSEVQTTTVTIMGVTYRSVYTQEFSDVMLTNPRRLFNQWNQIGSDGSMEGMTGLWYLEEFKLDGAIHTFARYRMQNDMPQMVPGQAALMQLFLAHDMAETVLNVSRIAAKTK